MVGIYSGLLQPGLLQKMLNGQNARHRDRTAVERCTQLRLCEAMICSAAYTTVRSNKQCIFKRKFCELHNPLLCGCCIWTWKSRRCRHKSDDLIANIDFRLQKGIDNCAHFLRRSAHATKPTTIFDMSWLSPVQIALFWRTGPSWDSHK